MRTVLLAVAVAGLMATVWFYANSATRENQTTSSGEPREVSAIATTDVTVVWVFKGEFVTGAKVTWTPKEAASYNLVVEAGGNIATFTTATTKANFTRTDLVTLPPTDPGAINSATVKIDPA